MQCQSPIHLEHNLHGDLFCRARREGHKRRIPGSVERLRLRGIARRQREILIERIGVDRVTDFGKPAAICEQVREVNKLSSELVRNAIQFALMSGTICFS